MTRPAFYYWTKPENIPWLSESPTKAELRADPEEILFAILVKK